MTVSHYADAMIHPNILPHSYAKHPAGSAPFLRARLPSTSDLPGKPIADALEGSRDRSQQIPNYSNYTPESLASPRHTNSNRKCYAPPTPSGTSRASSPSQASEEHEALRFDQSTVNPLHQSSTMSPGTRRNPQQLYNAVPIHAPIARSAPHRSHPEAGTSTGLGLRSVDVPTRAIQLLQQIVRDQEPREETMGLCSTEPPQSRYSARLRSIAPIPITLPGTPEYLLPSDDDDEFSLQSIAPANAKVATGDVSASTMDEEILSPEGVASIPPLSAVGAAAANLPLALQQTTTASSPALDLTPVSSIAILSFTNSPANPPPLPRLISRELPQLSPLGWHRRGVAYESEEVDMIDMADEMDIESIAGSSRTGQALSYANYLIDPLSILQAPAEVPTLLSPLNLQPGHRPEDLQGRIETCYMAVDYILYALGTSRLHMDQVDALCTTLKNLLYDIRSALHSAPTDLDLFGEDIGRQWLHKYHRVLDSLYKQVSYFDLLEQQLGRRPPRLHKVDTHLAKLWQYVAKFEDLLARLEHYHERLPALQLKLRFTAMHRAAREELSAERQRRREWKSHWDHERQQRKDLRDEVRRMRGTSRPPRHL